MSLTYASGQPPGTSSGQNSLNVIPSDTDDLPAFTRGIYVGSGGDLKIKDYRGVDSIYYAVPTGSFLPIVAGKIYATGTSASLLTIAY